MLDTLTDLAEKNENSFFRSDLKTRFGHSPGDTSTTPRRKTRWSWIAAVAALVLAASTGNCPASTTPPTAPAAAEPTDLAHLLVSVRSQLDLQQARFTGEGAAILQNAIARARYVLLGEDHLTREIPAFAEAVCNAMAPGGLAAMAMEVGPQLGDLINPLLPQQNVANILATLTHRYPDSVAFLNMREEAETVQHCATASGVKTFRLWGLDQEFLGAAGWLLDLISHQKLSADAAASIAKLQAGEQADTRDALKTGDPSTLFLLSANDNDLANVARVLRAGGNPHANAIFQELLVSHDIYVSQGIHAADSNHARAVLLKQNLLHDLQAMEPTAAPPRILFKFGDYHMYKGVNPLHQRDLGNFVAELADGQGATSLHIAVLGARGTHRLYGGYGRPTRLEPFTLTEDEDYAWISPAVSALFPTGWTVFDLTKLRFRKIKDVTPAWERLIYGYDFLVLTPSVTPATPL